MNTFTMRRAAAAAVIGLTSFALAAPAHAADVDEDDIAATYCPADSVPSNVDVATDADDLAEVMLFSYTTDGGDDAPGKTCVFGIITTYDDAVLDGSYSLTVGGAHAEGSIAGEQLPTQVLVTDTVPGAVATFSAAGHQVSVEIDKPSKSERKAAKKKYTAAKKKAHKAYAKAGKTKKAKKAMAKKIAKAKARYKAKTAPRRTVSRAGYGLDLTMPIEFTP